jgi:MoaA/NifB/PqqE/SkfB family radical SAM enzyme
MLKLKLQILKRALKPKPLLNLLVTYSSYCLSLLFRKSIVAGMPPLLMIEPTSHCNLNCPLCPSGNGTLRRQRDFMDLNLYKRVIDEVKGTVIGILLWNQGEPLLHKDLPEMIRYATNYGIFTMTSTNMNILPDPDALVNSGLGHLIVSLDGASQETYNKYRINGNFARVLENTARLVEAKKRKGSRTPFISWQFIIMKHNEHEIPQIKQLASEAGVDDLIFKTVQIYDKEDIDNFLPTKERYRRYKITDDGFILKKKITNRCRRIFTQPVVNCDGEFAICCFDKDNIYKVGNLNGDSLRYLWRGSRFNRWRNMVLRDRKKMNICLNCGEGIDLKIKE